VYLFNFDNPTMFVEISGVVSQKILALSQHKSQYTNETALADGVYSLAASIATIVQQTGYCEGFDYIPQMA